MVQMLNQHCEHNLQNDLSVQRFDKPHYLESFLSKSLLLCWPSLYRVRATDTRNRPRFSNWGIVLSSSRSSNHSLGNVEMIWKSRNRKKSGQYSNTVLRVLRVKMMQQNDATKIIISFDFSYDLHLCIKRLHGKARLLIFNKNLT